MLRKIIIGDIFGNTTIIELDAAEVNLNIPDSFFYVQKTGGSEDSDFPLRFRTYLSTSPSTMSMLPIAATTSETNPPFTISGRACRFTNDGPRTRIL